MMETSSRVNRFKEGLAASYAITNESYRTLGKKKKKKPSNSKYILYLFLCHFFLPFHLKSFTILMKLWELFY